MNMKDEDHKLAKQSSNTKMTLCLHTTFCLDFFKILTNDKLKKCSKFLRINFNYYF